MTKLTAEHFIYNTDEDELSAVFASILNRINENRPESEKITILDKETRLAVKQTLAEYRVDRLVPARYDEITVSVGTKKGSN